MHNANNFGRKATVLMAAMNLPEKRIFDAASASDLKIYKEFRKSGSWGKETCPFKPEWPYLSVPATIEAKIIDHNLRAV